MVVSAMIGSIYVYYGTTIPETCESKMKMTFMAMGILNIILGFVTLCATYAAKEMFSAMSHKVLVDKWASDPARADEAEEELEEYERDSACAARLGLGLCFATCIIYPCLWGVGFYGIVQASKGTDEKCGGAIKLYWVLLVVSLILNIGLSCKMSNQQQAFANQFAGAGAQAVMGGYRRT